MNVFNLTKTISVNLIWLSAKDQTIKSHDYDITYSLRTRTPENVSYEKAYIWQNISFSTINTFLYDQLYQSIVYDDQSKSDAERFMSSYDNNYIFLPTLSEAVLLHALHCKLNTICHPHSNIETLSIKLKEEQLSYNCINDDLEYPELPSIKEWLGELSIWDTPWWMRKDFSTFDNVALNQEEKDQWANDEKKQEMMARMSDPIKEIETKVSSQLSISTKDKGELIEIDFKDKKLKSKPIPKDKT